MHNTAYNREILVLNVKPIQYKRLNYQYLCIHSGQRNAAGVRTCDIPKEKEQSPHLIQHKMYLKIETDLCLWWGPLHGVTAPTEFLVDFQGEDWITSAVSLLAWLHADGEGDFCPPMLRAPPFVLSFLHQVITIWAAPHSAAAVHPMPTWKPHPALNKTL